MSLISSFQCYHYCNLLPDSGKVQRGVRLDKGCMKADNDGEGSAAESALSRKLQLGHGCWAPVIIILYPS